MLKYNPKGLLIVLSGPSGVGKGTLVNKLTSKDERYWLSVSMTTRNPRPGEIEGIHYFYVTKEEFEKRIENEEFLEYANVVSNNYYGTPKDKINDQLRKGKNVILEIDIEGALQVQEKVKEALFIFVMPPNMEELKNRLQGRGTETEEQVLARFKRAYQEINTFKKYNYVVVNDDIDLAIGKIKAIVDSEYCRVDRIEDVYLNSHEEAIHERLLDESCILPEPLN